MYNHSPKALREAADALEALEDDDLDTAQRVLTAGAALFSPLDKAENDISRAFTHLITAEDYPALRHAFILKLRLMAYCAARGLLFVRHHETYNNPRGIATCRGCGHERRHSMSCGIMQKNGSATDEDLILLAELVLGDWGRENE